MYFAGFFETLFKEYFDISLSDSDYVIFICYLKLSIIFQVIWKVCFATLDTWVITYYKW